MFMIIAIIIKIVWLILTIVCGVKIVRWWTELIDILKEMAKEIDRLTAEVKRLDSVVSVLTNKKIFSESEGFDGAY